jgi:hypothetical protein
MQNHKEHVWKIFLLPFFPFNQKSEMLLDQNTEGTIKPQYRIPFQQVAFQISFYGTSLAAAIIGP